MSDLNVEMTLNFDWIWKLNGRRNLTLLNVEIPDETLFQRSNYDVCRLLQRWNYDVGFWSADVFNQIQNNFNVGTTSYACWDGFLYMTLYQFSIYMTAINLDRLFAKHFLKLKEDRISVGS